jgi:NAD(P)-dependent dehydrogenase (short-subunit alcohol dehydrogenase family)
MMLRLSGKKTVIIGAGVGIGRAIALLFAREGADVFVADHDKQSDLDTLCAEIAEMGRRVISASVDVRSREDVERVINSAHAAFGRLDVLVNNAGISLAKTPFQKQVSVGWDQILGVNLIGTSHGMEFAIPIMTAQGSGSIINTSSQLAHKPAAGASLYSASKAAVVALSVAVAGEVAPLGVRVNVVCPGPTDTAMWRFGDSDWAQQKIDSLPIKRVGTPEEVAWAYVYLASDESTFMIGQTISPNGGDVMW